MKHRYEEICLGCGCSAKVYTKENSAIRKKIGTPDLMVFFTNTVSHKMVTAASQLAKQQGIPIARCHSSSASALTAVLTEHCTPNGAHVM